MLGHSLVQFSLVYFVVCVCEERIFTAKIV